MSEQTHNLNIGQSLVMPPTEQIAVETISRLAADGYTSQLMKLKRPLLNELARRILTPGVKRSHTFVWLNGELTADKANPIDDNAFYRFVQRFGERYKTVYGEHLSRLVALDLASNPAFGEGELLELAKNKAMQLLTQELLTANPADLDMRRFSVVLQGIRSAEQNDLQQRRLEMDKQLAERKSERMEAQVAVLRQQIERIPEIVKGLQKQFDDLSKRAQRGDSIDPSIFDSIRNELAGLVPVTSTGQEGGGA